MIKIDDYAYSSKLIREVPGNKLFFGAIPLVICLFANSFSTSVITILVMAVLCIRLTSISVWKYIKLLLVPFGFLLIGTATIIVSSNPIGTSLLFGVTVGETIYGISFTSLFYGLQLIFRALAAVSCMYFISLNTPMHDIVASLRKIKVPDLFISLMELIYRYIFVLFEEMHRIKTAQQSRLGYKDFKTSVRSTGELIAMLFLRTYMRCDRVCSALESRGYSGTLKTIEKDYSNEKHLILFTLILSVILIMAAVAERILL